MPMRLPVSPSAARAVPRRELAVTVAALRSFLWQRRNADGGWPYYADRQSRLEPTVWASLALSRPVAETPCGAWATREGLLVEPGVGIANLGFNGLAAAIWAGDRVTAPVVASLVGHKGVRVPAHPAIRQDPALQAWPWMDGTFSWVEPTAWCMLALKRSALRDRPEVRARIEEAERLLADRACTGGGWNFGNGVVYGTDLPAHVPSTAVAVLALQDLGPLPLVRDAVRFLQAQAVKEGSSASLALAWMALTALGEDSATIGDALEARADVAQEFGNVAHAAMLLYALESRAAAMPPRACMIR